MRKLLLVKREEVERRLKTRSTMLSPMIKFKNGSILFRLRRICPRKKRKSLEIGFLPKNRVTRKRKSLAI